MRGKRHGLSPEGIGCRGDRGHARPLASVLEALDSVTKREGETYESFVERAGKNEIGRRVKLADLIDNSDLSRITAPSEKDHARIAKYRRAIKMLTECTQLQNSET